MPVYRVQCVSTRSGDHAAAWVDDARFLWDDDRLASLPPLAAGWKPPRLLLARPDRGPTDVLFNPNALFVSETIRSELAHFAELEFLPARVKGAGTFYVLRPVTTRSLPRGTLVRRNEVSRNVTVVHAFPRSFSPRAAFFRVRHPRDSAAAKRGYCLPDLFVNERGARALAETCGAYLEARPMNAGRVKTGVVLHGTRVR